MTKSKKLRCLNCNRVLGILKKDLLEVKCPKCGSLNLYDPKKRAIIGVRKGDKK